MTYLIVHNFVASPDLIYQSYLNNGQIPAASNNDPSIPLNDLDEVKIAGFAWFTYNCFEGKAFNTSSDNRLLSCRGSYSAPLKIDEKPALDTSFKEKSFVNAYPNPAKDGKINIVFRSPDHYELNLYRSDGHRAISRSVNVNKKDHLFLKYYDKGILLLQVTKLDTQKNQFIKIIFQ